MQVCQKQLEVQLKMICAMQNHLCVSIKSYQFHVLLIVPLNSKSIQWNEKKRHCNPYSFMAQVIGICKNDIVFLRMLRCNVSQQPYSHKRLPTFNDYVEIFFSIFDHLPTVTWTFLTLNMDKNRHFWTTYPPLLVCVVIEGPQTCNCLPFHLYSIILQTTHFLS